jgi:hypothetical protein
MNTLTITRDNKNEEKTGKITNVNRNTRERAQQIQLLFQNFPDMTPRDRNMSRMSNLLLVSKVMPQPTIPCYM